MAKKKDENISEQSEDRPCDCEETWFRSSDDVRQGYVVGIENFDVRSVTYNVIGERAIFEGDIALGSVETMDSIKQSVEGQTTEGVRSLADITAPGEVVRGIGITGQRFRWPRGLVPFSTAC